MRVLIGAVVLLGCSPPAQSAAKPSRPLSDLQLVEEKPAAPLDTKTEQEKQKAAECAYESRSLIYFGDPCAPEDPTKPAKKH